MVSDKIVRGMSLRGLRVLAKSVIIAILTTSLLFMPVSCASPEHTTPPASPEPTKFEVIHLHINPNGVMPGDPITITATIENTGEMEGTYTAILILAGQELERKDVSVGSEARGTAIFEVISPEAAGNYELTAGEASSTLTVFDQQPELRQYLLSYDDGLPDSSFWSGEESYLVEFSPPAKLFTVERVLILGWVSAKSEEHYQNRQFTVKLWDKNTGSELVTQNFPWRLFGDEAKWVELDITNTTVDDDFYVTVTTNSTRENRINIDYDTSTPNEHSYMSRNGKIIPWATWAREEVEYTREKVNWMIRVSGRAPVD